MVIEKFRKKIESQNGATIVFALAVFLVAVIISFSLVTISSTAIKTSGKQLKDEQAYLAVSSAARMIQKQLDGLYIEVEYPGDITGGESLSGTYKIKRTERLEDETGAKYVIREITGDNLVGFEAAIFAVIKGDKSMTESMLTVTSSDAPGMKMNPVKVIINAPDDRDDYGENGFSVVFQALDEKDDSVIYQSSLDFYGYSTNRVKRKPDNTVKSTTTRISWRIYNDKTGNVNDPDEP